MAERRRSREEKGAGGALAWMWVSLMYIFTSTQSTCHLKDINDGASSGRPGQ